MYIRVTGCTTLAKSQIGITPFFQTGVTNIIRLVALAAINGFVFARQFVAGRTMVEFILVEAHNVKIPAMVVAVAGDTVFTSGLSGCVETGSLINSAFYLLVATQAFVIGNLIAQNMAFGAIEHPFQTGMRLRQIAWRQLCIHPECKEDDEKGDM